MKSAGFPGFADGRGWNPRSLLHVSGMKHGVFLRLQSAGVCTRNLTISGENPGEDTTKKKFTRIN